MWTQVTSKDESLVEAAYRVLSLTSTRWLSPKDFKAWLETHDDDVFYFAGESYQLVLGVSRNADGSWQGSIAGISGETSFEALGTLISKAVDLVRQHKADKLRVLVSKLPPTSHFGFVYSMAIGIAQGHPHIASIRQRAAGRHREYIFTLRRKVA